eukprot:982410-Pyramimonas_sp.AAC.1
MEPSPTVLLDNLKVFDTNVCVRDSIVKIIEALGSLTSVGTSSQALQSWVKSQSAGSDTSSSLQVYINVVTPADKVDALKFQSPECLSGERDPIVVSSIGSGATSTSASVVQAYGLADVVTQLPLIRALRG